MSEVEHRAVLVTAASTPVGREIVGVLERAGHAVVAVSHEDAAGDGHAGVHWRRCDLTRYRDVHRLLDEAVRDFDVGLVVHTPLHRSVHDTGRHVWRLNVESTRTLLKLAEEHERIEGFVLRSHAEVYRIDSDLPSIVSEDQPLDFRPTAPQRTRDWIEADTTACAFMGTSRLCVTVLRCAEVLAPDSGSQLHDYLRSRVCIRPLGFDPMINVLSAADAGRAVCRAVEHRVARVFNVAGRDTLPLSRIIALAGRTDVPLPGPLLGPLYRARRRAIHTEFDYAMNRERFHFGGVLDGTLAERELGYAPRVGIDWDALASALRAR